MKEIEDVKDEDLTSENEDDDELTVEKEEKREEATRIRGGTLFKKEVSNFKAISATHTSQPFFPKSQLYFLPYTFNN